MTSAHRSPTQLTESVGPSQPDRALLFDQNLSFKLCMRLSDVFPRSSHVGLLGLGTADNEATWARARLDGLAIVSQDADFAERAALQGPPPKVIWLRLSNRSTAEIEHVLRDRADAVHALLANAEASCLEIY